MSATSDSFDTPARALNRRAHELGDRPLFTSLVDGGREELGWVTADNWATKTANLLTEEVGLERGQRVLLGLPAGWPAAVVTLGCWRAGLAVVAVEPDDHDALTRDAASTQPAAAAVVAESALAGLGHPGVPVFAVGPGLGGRLEAAPVPGVLPFSDEVLACGDQWLGEDGEPDDDAWREPGGAVRPQRSVLETGTRFARDALREGDRLLVDAGAGGPLGGARGLCGALSSGAAMVLVADEQGLLAALDQEQPDVALVSAAGLATLLGREAVRDRAADALRAVHVLGPLGEDARSRAHDQLGVTVEAVEAVD